MTDLKRETIKILHMMPHQVDYITDEILSIALTNAYAYFISLPERISPEQMGTLETAYQELQETGTLR